MLDVSLNLAAVMAMLFGIVVPGVSIKVDSLNSPTAKPIPGRKNIMGTNNFRVKGHIADFPIVTRWSESSYRPIPMDAAAPFTISVLVSRTSAVCFTPLRSVMAATSLARSLV